MKRLLVLVMTLVLVVAACGSDDEPLTSGDGNGSSAGDDDRDTIEGEYVSVSVTEAGEPLALFEGTEVSLRLQDGDLSMQADCNSLGGSYSIDEGVLTTDTLSMTEIGCPEPGHTQDQWLADLVSAGPTVEPVEEGLVLTAGDRSIEFADESVANPDRDLVGTEWEVTGFIHGAGPDAAVSSASGDAGQLVFGDDGFVTGYDGCNDFGFGTSAGEEPEGLAYSVEEDRIRFEGEPATTLVDCPGVDTDAFHAVLTGTVTYEVDGASLTLRNEDGTGVTYRVADG